jgi:TetR/AcrR family transcriptional regulator, transcriptional repressor for nem operon
MNRHAAKSLTREKLLDQGVALLMENGYHGTGLHQLLQTVGVPKGSFYNYFDSKEEFGAHVVQHYLEPFIQLLDDYLERPGLDGAQALEGYFAELITELNRARFKGGCLLGNLIGEIGDTSETCRTALASAVLRYRDRLMAGIARGQREGVFRHDRSALELADFLSDAWQGALLRMKIEQSTRPLEQCCRNLLGDYFRA